MNKYKRYHQSEKGRAAKRRYKQSEKGKAASHRAYRNYCIKLKNEVINYYGGECACCGIKWLAFLTIDHVDGRGKAHRRQVGRCGLAFYRWLKKNKFPKGYQVLCWNCNCGRAINNGVCPHKEI